MDKQILLLRSIYENPDITQRGIAGACGLSLGKVNKLIKQCSEEGFISSDRGHKMLTEKGLDFLEPFRVEAAVIMAAGFGSRFVPLTFETPKGLLKVFGEPMIERQIKQLHGAGVTDIAVVVGYMKEKFEYLTDKYGCRLIYNPQYRKKNNISTIHTAYPFLYGRNAYILSSDNWIRDNIFHTYEAAAWYSARHFDGDTSEWVLKTDRHGLIKETFPGGRNCDCMLGPAYFSREFSSFFLPVLERLFNMPGTDDFYWEHVLMYMLDGTAARRLNAYYGHIPELNYCDKIRMYINLQSEDNIYEFENLEELRSFDPRYLEDSGSKAMQLVSRVFKVHESSITHIRRLKAGMTNNSWLFTVDGKSYICRIPGEGTDILINRKQEKASFDAVRELGITETVIYFDETTGYKISEYYEDSRCADPGDPDDMERCMQLLRKLHSLRISVPHSFDIGERLDYYEDLCGGALNIPFSDYSSIKEKRDMLLSWLEGHKNPPVLCHIDSVADNFLFLTDGSLKLIDWEYSGMCDPLIDIGMCAIYSFMDENGACRLMEAYFGREPSEEERQLVYAYMALGGLLWALWGVYKEKLGVDFTDYTIKMYRYFKKYSDAVLKNIYNI